MKKKFAIVFNPFRCRITTTQSFKNSIEDIYQIIEKLVAKGELKIEKLNNFSLNFGSSPFVSLFRAMFKIESLNLEMKTQAAN